MNKEAIKLQNNAVSTLHNLLKNREKREYTFRAPTGSGKTFMMAKFMNEMLEANDDVIFLVSSLSKSNLSSQNYNKFVQYKKSLNMSAINPYLISSETSSEESLFIPLHYNVYLLPNSLYASNTKLMRGGFIGFLEKVKFDNYSIIWIKDEAHVSTKNLDEIAEQYFDVVVNFSATPKMKKNQFPDVEITDEEAENANLIKKIEWGDDNDTLEDAIVKFKSIKNDYINMLGVNPCLIIQVSNAEKFDDEWNSKILPALSNNQDIKWMLLLDESKGKGDTNDKIKEKKIPVSKWKQFAKSNLSGIDVIIFKLVISEGWDIPRACMLYQLRDSQSKQLDEQVIGRIRRNPRLLDYELLSEEAKSLAMTGWVWGVHEEKQKLIQVQLKKSHTSIKSQIKVKTTLLRPLTNKTDFSFEQFISEKKKSVAGESIFSIYHQLFTISDETKNIIYNYSKNYQDWFFTAALGKEIEKANNKYLCNYKDSMYVDTETSIHEKSFFVENTDNTTLIDNWIWERKDGSNWFGFDSKAEEMWVQELALLCKEYCATITHISHSGKNIYLWGKNYPDNSSIHYQYYNDSLHMSYPDFVMKDKFGRIHIFEVKSINKSSKINLEENDYKQKILDLKACYIQASKITSHYFYLPILDGNTWKITCFINGIESNITLKEFKKLISE